jgi:hypothetical protein
LVVHVVTNGWRSKKIAATSWMDLAGGRGTDLDCRRNLGFDELAWFGVHLARAAQSDTYAAETADPDIREMYRRMAGQWYRLAVEHEARADALG